MANYLWLLYMYLQQSYKHLHRSPETQYISSTNAVYWPVNISNKNPGKNYQESVLDQ